MPYLEFRLLTRWGDAGGDGPCRSKAPSSKAGQKHFAQKLEEENAKVETAEAQQAVLEEEFTVSYLVPVTHGSRGLDGFVRLELDHKGGELLCADRELTHSYRY